MEIDLSLVSTADLLFELKKRFDDYLFLAYVENFDNTGAGSGCTITTFYSRLMPAMGLASDFNIRKGMQSTPGFCEDNLPDNGPDGT